MVSLLNSVDLVSDSDSDSDSEGSYISDPLINRINIYEASWRQIYNKAFEIAPYLDAAEDKEKHHRNDRMDMKIEIISKDTYDGRVAREFRNVYKFKAFFEVVVPYLKDCMAELRKVTPAFTASTIASINTTLQSKTNAVYWDIRAITKAFGGSLPNVPIPEDAIK